MELSEKKAILRTLERGQTITLTDGRTAAFIELKRTRFHALLNQTTLSIPIEMFAEVGAENTDHYRMIGYAKKEREHDDFDYKKSLLKKLNPGDKILATNGDKVIFVKLNRTQFVGKLIGKNQTYTYPVLMFDRVLEESDQSNVSLKNLVRAFKGTLLETSIGYATVGQLTDDETNVILYNGVVTIVSLEEFKELLKKNNKI